MTVETNTPTIRHNTERNRFELPLADSIAVVDYHMDGNTMVFTHAGVPRQHEGQGIASNVTRAALDYAKEQGYAIRAVCPFVAAYIDRHPDYQQYHTGA